MTVFDSVICNFRDDGEGVGLCGGSGGSRYINNGCCCVGAEPLGVKEALRVLVAKFFFYWSLQ